MLCACGCGNDIIKQKHHSYYHAKFIHGHHRRGYINDKHPNYNGGRTKRYGYILILNHDHPFNRRGYVPEHRLVWEQNNNAMLLTWGAVHHLNGIKDDNRIENLEAMMKGKHSSHHRYKEIKEGKFAGIKNIMKYNLTRSKGGSDGLE